MNNFIALCSVGSEPILTNELKLAGFSPYNRTVGRVFFSSKEALLPSVFKANYFLRTTDRIFLLLAKKKITDFDSFFSLIHDIEWEKFFNKNAKILLDKVSVFKSKLASEHALQSMAYKAICTRLCNKWNMHTLSESGKKHIVRIYLEHDELYVCLDTSGEPLYKRGYRLSGGTAPLRETVAASLLQFMQWKRKSPLHDAFTGSGTIPIEATYFACNIPPGINRNFAFEDFACFNEDEKKEVISIIKNEALENVRTDCLIRITASDIDPSSVSLAKANAERACILAGRVLTEAGHPHHIPRPEIFQSSFNELKPPYDQGMLISNPPYGVRLLDQEKIAPLYKDIAKKLQDFRGWKLGFITNKEDFETTCYKENKKLDIKTHRLKTGNMQMYFYVLNFIDS
ncbi:MAG: THUMP domain-containing class I SAM-dependent RNA methyltransferase [Treponema sp.]